MLIELINTGTELLLGHTINTHLSFLGQELFAHGLRIARQVTVPDGEAIRDALSDSFTRAEIVFVTGGLGPTTDDITREITAELLGLELREDHIVLQAITKRFARRGLVMSERVKRQALVPSGGTILANANGTAPGLYFDLRSLEKIRHSDFVARHLFLLPGPPRELKPMFADSVRPVLDQVAPRVRGVTMRTFRVIGVGESSVEAAVGEEILAIHGIELGYCARPGEVEVRCIGTEEMLAHAERIVTAKLGAQIASSDNRSLEEIVVASLANAGKKLAVAESCTGGFIANRLTNVPGASDIFVAGYVTYANESKTDVLGVASDLLARHGAVSAEVAAAMAEGARSRAQADFALSTTGIAGPGGGTKQKPVGTVFIGLTRIDGETTVEQYAFPTDRETFKWLVSQAALDLLRRAL